jgi:predicted adenylyl cyclase CyaB
MRTNLELKVSYPSLDEAASVARALGARREGVLHQRDTYFLAGAQRLKLREIRGGRSELIYYERSDSNSSRYSRYSVVGVKNRTAVKRLFSSLFGVRVVVTKRRLLYIHKNARIHIDSVQGLGNYLEFEVLVTQGKRQTRTLMIFLQKQFGIKENSVIGGSYSDLLLRRVRRGTNRA